MKCRQCESEKRGRPEKGIHTCRKAPRKPSIDWEAERKAFEDWYGPTYLGWAVGTRHTRLASGEYYSYQVQHAWEVWQKARNSIPKVSFK